MSSGDEAADLVFVPPKSRRGKDHMVETGGSRGGTRTKLKAKRKKHPTPSSGKMRMLTMKILLKKLSVMVPTMFPMLI
jgi:hypothetical protein